MISIQKRAALFIAVLLFIYVALRAAFIPFTFDEIQTFAFYIEPGELQPFFSRLDANNHVLNSLLSRFNYLLFGKSIFALRLANVLAFALFILYAFKLELFFRSKNVWLLFFLTLVFCHFLLDFFNLCRGYGLSMSFMLGAIFHLIDFSRKHSIVPLAFSCLSLSLAVWANLSLLIFAMALLVVLTCHVLHRLTFNYGALKILGYSVSIIVLLILPLGYAVYYSLELQHAGALYYGSDTGLWQDTVSSLVNQISEGAFWGWPLLYLAFFIYGASLIRALLRVSHKLESHIPHALLWLTILGTILAHHLFEVKYPLDRAALHFIILFVLSLFCLIDNSPNWLKISTTILPLVLFIHFSTTLGTTHSVRWKTEAIPNDFHHVLRKWQQEYHKPPTVSAPIYQTVNLSFRDGLLEPVLYPNIVPNQESSYSDFIIYNKQLSGLENIELLEEFYDTCLYDSHLQTVLFKRKPYSQRLVVNAIQIPATNSKELYINLADIHLDTVMKNQVYRIDIELEVKSDFSPLQWWLVTRFDSKKEILGIYYSDLQLSLPSIKKPKTLGVSHLVEGQPKEMKSLKIYIQNHKQKPIEILGGSVSVTELE